MTRALLAVLLVALLATTAAYPRTPAFQNGPLVSRSLERHFNSAAYEARLKRSGGRLTSRVLCAYERPLVNCSGRMRAAGQDVRASWKLAKVSTTRARLSWVFRTFGIASRDNMLIAPREIGLKRF